VTLKSLEALVSIFIVYALRFRPRGFASRLSHMKLQNFAFSDILSRIIGKTFGNGILETRFKLILRRRTREASMFFFEQFFGTLSVSRVGELRICRGLSVAVVVVVGGLNSITRRR